MEIVAQEIHGKATAVTKVPKLALSYKSMNRRCSIIAAPLKEIVLAKLLHAPALGFNYMKSTDITSTAQLIVYVRFLDTQCKKIADPYLFWLLLA